MQHVPLVPHIRSVRAALETYRDAVDELERLNWSGGIADALRRLDALKRLSAACATEELERLAELPQGG